MNHLRALFALLLLALPCAALAQKGTPTFQVDKSGTTRCISAWDLTKSGADKGVHIGCINTTTHTWMPNPITPQDFDPQAGTGGDDAAALNAAVVAASNASGPSAGEVYLPSPPSGFYNVCSDSFRIMPAADGVASLTIRGPSGGGAAIRAKPGCTSGAVLNATMFIEGGAAFGSNVKSATKLTFENVRIDGNCISTYSVENAYSVGLTFRNSVLRNAATGSGANYYQEAGYETSIDSSNRAENVNDTGQTCYASASDLPNYNFWISGTDSSIGAVAVDAKVANFYADHGGNNHFIGAHGWGYNGTGDGQPDLRPQYNFLIEGNQVLVGAVADGPTVAGVRLQNTISDNSGAIVAGTTLIAPASGSVAGISLGSGVVNSQIHGNNLSAASSAAALVSDVAIDSSNSIFGNIGTTNGQPWNTYTPTASCQTGTLTSTSSIGGRYQVIGKTVFVYARAVINVNGTCAGAFKMSLPFASLADTTIQGQAFISSLKSVTALVSFGTSTAVATNYDGTYPGANGGNVTIEGVYEAQ